MTNTALQNEPQVFFKHRPSTMSKDIFLSKFSSIYEHSPWVAETMWENTIDASDDQINAFHTKMMYIVNNFGHNKLEKLILAHPDLAGKAALSGNLTDDSTLEQASAGLDQCSAEELARLTGYNDQYKAKFGFPFIMAIRHSSKLAILEAFPKRLLNSQEEEFAKAIEEIHKIALFRLQEI